MISIESFGLLTMTRGQPSDFPECCKVSFLGCGAGLDLQMGQKLAKPAQQPLGAEENSLAAINKTVEVLLTELCAKADVCSLSALVRR